jgi:hypothetical protein
LTEGKQFKEEKQLLDLLSKGLSTEFPNPERVGCPGPEVLEGIASHKTPLSEAEKWLDHLGSCSSCFHDFKAIQRKLRARRVFKLGGSLAILLVVLALWFGLRPHHAVITNETATLDLRGYSVERGQQSPSKQPPLDIRRGIGHLILYLPIGSTEGTYEVALLSNTGYEADRSGLRVVFSATGTARLEDHIVILRTDLDLAGVRPGSYFLGLRQPGQQWTRFPARVL